MIPIGRPFLEYVISALADAGLADVCLVIAPHHDAIREHFERRVQTERVRIHFAVQPVPRGSADALLAAQDFAESDHFVVVNSDNYYPVHTLRGLRDVCLDRAYGVAAFEREALIRLSNIDASRVLQYSILELDEHGRLARIIEKPTPAQLAAQRGGVFVGMNSWALGPSIFRACREIAPSQRGELELPLAAQYAREKLGVPFRVLTFHEGVLDLSTRADIAAVAERLRDVVPTL